MKKMISALIVFALTVPALASVTITAIPDGNEVTIWYDNTEPNNVRAFGLNIDANNGAVITVDETSFNDQYNVYPGSIDINDGGWVYSNGSPIAVADGNYPGRELDGIHGITVEMGSLYYGAPNEPDPCGILLKFTVDKNCCITLEENAARAGADSNGVVMEDHEEGPDVTLVGCCVTVEQECYEGMADYSEWDAAGKPDCWCYPRQCHADADGLQGGDPFEGYYYVGSLDLGILIDAWKVLEPPFGPGITSVPNGACADFDHLLGGDPFEGYYRVGSLDLGILITYWKVLEAPFGSGIPGDCSPGNRTP